MDANALVALIPALPLAGFLFAVLVGARFDRVPLHVVRQADVRRAGPSRRHLAECRAHRVRDLLGAVDHPVPLGHRPE
jgi:hypothetical protein